MGRRVHSLRKLFTKTQIIGNINNGLLRSWGKDLQGEVGGAGGGCHDAPGRRSHGFLSRPSGEAPIHEYGKRNSIAGTPENGQKGTR
jgi:hypothetical protein